MKRTNIEKIKRELGRGFNPDARRAGWDYGRGWGDSLDAALDQRAKYARRWREEVLDAEERVGPLYEERKVIGLFRGARRNHWAATVYRTEDGRPVLARKGTTTIKRWFEGEGFQTECDSVLRRDR